LEKKITLLEYEAASLSSMAYIEKQARAAGFVDIDGTLAVVTPDVAVASALR